MVVPNPKIIVLGVGNEFRGDDGVGPVVLSRLVKANLPETSVEFRNCDTASIIDHLRDDKTVIVVDAAATGSSPGKVHRLDGCREPIPRDVFSVSTHFMGVAEAVELARSLNRLPKRFIIYGIEGKNFDYGVGLSPEVEKAVGEVAKMIIREIEDQTGTHRARVLEKK